MSYKLAQLLPKTDSTYLAYEDFKKTFGQDGSMIIIANKDSRFFTAKHLNAFNALQQEISQIEGIKETGGISNILEIEKDTATTRFVTRKLFDGPITTDAEAKEIKSKLSYLPFYDGLLFDLKKDVYMLLITLEQDVLDTKERIRIVEEIREKVETFEEANQTEIHISGLPYIRTVNVKKARSEISLFVGLAALVTMIVLIILFRSPIEVIVPLVIVALGIVWAQGVLGLLGYKITILTGLIPPLLIVIGIPNAIYIINKYHQEYGRLKDKKVALIKVIEKTGQAIFLTNLTTAIGFGTFIITGSDVLVEFGIVASINIMLLFLLALIMIPILFSFLPPPSDRARAHMDKKLANAVVRVLIVISQYFRKWVYIVTAGVLLVASWGITKIEVKGNVVDDVPEKSEVMVDLRFFENSFGGVLPMEISIDTKKPGSLVSDPKVWRKINELQEYIDAQPIFAKPVSYIEGLKFANQAFYNGSPEEYRLPNQFDRAFIVNYLQKNESQDSLLGSLMNKDKSIARISLLMKDLNTIEIQHVKEDLQKKSAEIFPPDKYRVTITGGSVAFLEGTKYLVFNLIQSLLLAVIIIAFFMALLFKNIRIVFISLIPNLVPMVFTAGLMGYFGIPIKPSTILIFSIAFGISVDDTIHFLAKFKEEMRQTGNNIRSSVILTLRETALSMAYTSIVLFFGFSVFAASDFGGTVALGTLVAFTLFAAAFTNLMLLPALLISLHVSKAKPSARSRRKKKQTNTNLPS